MLFLTMLVLFCYMIHKLCEERGLAPWNYLAGYITGWFVVLLVTSIAIVVVYGQNIIHDPDAAKKILIFTPFTLLFHFLLFIFFRHRITSITAPEYIEHDDDMPSNGPPKEKKDLSYFR
jgi:hypothetical protein